MQLASLADLAVAATRSSGGQLASGDHGDDEILRFRRIRVERQPVIVGETHPLLARSGNLLLVAGAGGKTAVSRDGGVTWKPTNPIFPAGEGIVDALSVRDGVFVARVRTPQAVSAVVSPDGEVWQVKRDLTPQQKLRPVPLTSGRLLAATKLPGGEEPADSDSRTALIESPDHGETWSDPRPITRSGQAPGSLAQLPDGRLVLSYVEHTDPYGARAIISDDGGKSWGESVFVLGVSRYGPRAKPRPGMCNPSTGVNTVSLPDGTLVSAFDRGRAVRDVDEEGNQPTINVVRWTPEGLTKPPLVYPNLWTEKVDKQGYLDNGMVRMRPDDRFYGGDYVEQHEMIVYRRLPAQQLEFPDIGTHGVVVCRHPDGSLLFTCREPVIYRSTDEGRTWQKLADIGLLDNLSEQGRWASWGFGVTGKGTLLYSYGIQLPVGKGYIARSDDNGKTWTQVALDPAPMQYMGHGDSSRILELTDGTVIMSCGNAWAGEGLFHWATHRGYQGDIILRSTDDGKTWGDGTVLTPGACESNFLEFPSGKLLVATRYQRHPTVFDLFKVIGPQPLPLDPDASRDMPIMPNEEEYDRHPWWGRPNEERGAGRFKNEAVMISNDGGRSFTTPEIVTRIQMVSADVTRLKDGRVVLVYQHKDAPYGVRAIVSRDEGDTWEDERYILGYGLKRAGRASSVALRDGNVYTLNALGGKAGVQATIWQPE